MHFQALSILSCLSCLLLAVVPAANLRADDDEALSADDIWWEAAELLQRREYALAENIIQNEMNSPGTYERAPQLQADLVVVRQLVELSQLVADQCKKLDTGYEFQVAGTPHKFVSFEPSKPGKNLVLLNRRGIEVTHALRNIDASSWIGLAETKMSDWEDKQLVLAAFWTYDRSRDTKLARSYLNVVAESGTDVSVWMDRLAQIEAKKHLSKKADNKGDTPSDRIIGKWRVAIQGGAKINIDIRPKGKATIYHEGKAYAALWDVESDEVIRLTGERGKTFLINVGENRFSGQMASGNRFQGTRMAGG